MSFMSVQRLREIKRIELKGEEKKNCNLQKVATAKNGVPPSAVPAYGSDKLPRLTYSITPQFGNRGTSRSDVKTRTVQACKSVVVRRATKMHAQSGV